MLTDKQQKIVEFKKARAHRKYDITNSVGAKEAARYYIKTGNLDESTFRKVVRACNLGMQDLLSQGEDIILPCNMGKLVIEKMKTSVTFKDGKLEIDKPINWKETLNLWYEDSSAREQKLLVRNDVPFVFRVRYYKARAVLENKIFLYYATNRALKLKLKENILNNKLEAFTSYSYGD